MSPKRGRDNIDVDDEDGDGEGETKTIQIVNIVERGKGDMWDVQFPHAALLEGLG